MFYTISYLISLMVSLLTILSGFYAAFYRSHTLRGLPRALRLYLAVSYFVPVILTAVLSVIIALMYFSAETQGLVVINILRLLIIFTSQTTRNFFFTVVLERIVATILLEKYTISYKINLFWILLAFSQIITFSFAYLFYKSGFILNTSPGYKVFIFAVFSFYLITIATFTLLYFLNKRMYKVSAYRITLQRRHQIVENVKVLAYLFPCILIYTILTPLASIITIFGFFYQLPAMPHCIFHFFYNLPQLLIFTRHIIVYDQKIIERCQCSHVTSVKTVMGKWLPISNETELYFKNLKQQWL